ncbi:MAG TPA: RNA methyltransferase [Polyangiaceae bacterium]|nr:RNA methyltransferase [Polyangiaceae bacterium]
MRRTSENLGEASELAQPWPEGWTTESVIERLEPLTSEARRQRLLQIIERRVSAVTVLMDAPHDPHNAAAVIRTCEAFGLPELHVVPRDERLLFARSVTRGAQRWVNVTVHSDPTVAVGRLHAQGFELVATDPDGELLPDELSRIPRLALLLGNEHSGLRPELLRAASRSVRIPMRGFTESLNVSVAAAVLLASATQSRPGDLSPEQRRIAYARGLYHSVTSAREILRLTTPPVLERPLPNETRPAATFAAK